MKATEETYEDLEDDRERAEADRRLRSTDPREVPNTRWEPTGSSRMLDEAPDWQAEIR
jgi:hypothetical protein